MTFSKIAIIGPGLLGGSIAMAARARNVAARISVWARREEALRGVEQLGIADCVSTDLKAVVAEAALIVFCVPIGAMSPLAEKMAGYVPANALVTDVGSVKRPVVESLGRIFAGRARFVGSHPMAGSEQTGIEAARADLFEGTVCIVTPEGNTPPEDVRLAREFWAALGCRPEILTPAEHDEVIALVSHLPHLLAATLVNLVCEQNADSLNFTGSGFRDTTRVASGSPAMWAEIFDGNREQVRKSVLALIEKLKGTLDFMDDDTKMRQFLTDAKSRRDSLKIPKI
ncbi:MAG TPA: prephenate dehydrogenase [Chthoniobacteraceae bacterium]|nr:prephenate dehydrogenase [Chthoniobacteraceae bacterium]